MCNPCCISFSVVADCDDDDDDDEIHSFIFFFFFFFDSQDGPKIEDHMYDMKNIQL